MPAGIAASTPRPTASDSSSPRRRYLDESRHRVPVAARRPRRRLVGVDARGAARLHQPRVRRLPLPRPRARASAARSARRRSTRSPSCRRGTARGGRTPAISLLGVLALVGADRVQRRRVVAQGARSARSSPKRGCAPRRPRRWRAPESEGKKNVELLSEIGREITSSLDFDTIFGKLYERVNQLADADVFGVGPLPSRAPARSSTAWPSRRASATRPTRATRPTANQLPVWCIEHREPVFINDLADRVPAATSARYDEDEPAARGRLDVAAAAVDHLPAAHRQGPRARHHHHPELREERLHRASPQRDAEPGVLHRHRARQRRTPTGSSTSRSTRSGGCSRRPSRRAPSPRKPTPPRARSSRR